MTQHRRFVRHQAVSGIGTPALALLLGAALMLSPTSARSAPSCPAGQVAVTLEGDRSCAALRTVLPRVRAADPRRALARLALGWDGSALRPRRNAPALRTVLAQLSPDAPAALRAAVNETLSRLDVLASARTASPTARLPALHAESRCAGAGVGGSETRSRDLGNGLSIDARATSGPDPGIAVGLRTDDAGRSARIEFELGLCPDAVARVEAPACPTAAGSLDGSMKDSPMRWTAVVQSGGKVVWSQTLRLRQATKLHGQVDDDARLAFIDIEDRQEGEMALGSETSGLGRPFVARWTITRRARVDGRTGRYVAPDPAVVVSVTLAGLSGAALAATERALAEEFEGASDSTFGAVADKALAAYRQREHGWRTANACTSIRLSPAPDTLRLRKGQVGRFQAAVLAQSGRAVPDGVWSVRGVRNLDVQPRASMADEPAFTYTVRRAGPGISAAATVHATSRAGIAEATWSQRTGNFTEEWGGYWHEVVTRSSVFDGVPAEHRLEVHIVVTETLSPLERGLQLRGRMTATYELIAMGPGPQCADFVDVRTTASGSGVGSVGPTYEDRISGNRPVLRGTTTKRITVGGCPGEGIRTVTTTEPFVDESGVGLLGAEVRVPYGDFLAGRTSGTATVTQGADTATATWLFYRRHR